MRDLGLEPRTGDVLTLHIRPISVAATHGAFAAILSDGSVVSWGHGELGGDCQSKQSREHPRNVWFLKTTDVAVAAVLGNGTVLTWGYAFHGGDSSSVQDQLQNVTHLQALRKG